MTKENGKMKVEKGGLKEITREGFEYELTANLELSTNHLAKASKDRTGLFMGKPEFVPSEETGKQIAAWCEQGTDVQGEVIQAIANLSNVNTLDELKEFGEMLPEYVSTDTAFRSAAITRQTELKNIHA